MIVKPGAPKLPVIQRKPQGANEVKPGTSIGAKTNDVTGIRWNLRLIKYDVNQNGLTTTRITIATRYKTGTSFIQR